MKLRHALILLLSTAALSGAAATAFAQAEAGDAPRETSDGRIDRLEKQLREVREIVLQARSTGQPVEIKEAGPDPQVTALSAKFDDMDQTLRSLNGQIESLTHDIEVAHKDADDAKAANQALSDRLDKLEKDVAAQAAAPPPPPPSDAGAPSPDAAQASPAPGGGDPKVAYANARKLMMDGDYPSAAAAYQDYVDHYGKQPNAPEARYWLGETKYAQEDYAGAAVAYIAAIHGWPQTAWGADADVKLALSLLALNKPTQACQALGEFDRHYAKASAAEKARADGARVKAKCGG
jgi:tol-pal system protein YbgF